jgi:hypothetical protein
MRLRSALIGATVSWKPGKDEKGTTVEIRVNLPEMQNLSSVGAAVQHPSSNSAQGASIEGSATASGSGNHLAD